MDDEEIKPRLDRLTWRVDCHTDQINKLHEQTSDLKSELSLINKSLMQIKWIAVGAAVVILGQSLGVTSIMKLLGV
jgi:hypothetical protein